MRRNRLIACLSRALIIAEAGETSGALHAARFAHSLGRPVFVPPQVGRAVYVILGISLGSSVTPETAAT